MTQKNLGLDYNSLMRRPISQPIPSNMLRLIVTIVFLATLISCTNRSAIEFHQLVGTYHQIEGAEDYNYLELLEDSTFCLMHSLNFGDMMLHFYGKWQIKGNTIQLIESVDLEAYLNVEGVRNVASDSLLLTIDSKLKDVIGGFKLKLNVNSTVWKNPQSIEFHKSEYRNDIMRVYGKPELFDEEMDMNKLVNGLIWNQNYHLFIDRVFNNSVLKLNLKKRPSTSNKDSILATYQWVEGVLISDDRNREIPSHHLVKE